MREDRLVRSGRPKSEECEEREPWGAESGRLNGSLSAQDGSLVCSSCEQGLGELDGNYKSLLQVERIHAHDLGQNYGPEDSEFELRLFFCPKCGHLATNEVALVEEKIAEDVRVLGSAA
jgi:hypothetical protein